MTVTLRGLVRLFLIVWQVILSSARTKTKWFFWVQGKRKF